MKTLVVHYSVSGHTRQIAHEIAEQCGADQDEIREAQPREGPLAYLRLAWQAMRRAAASILPAAKDPGDYDLVVIGTPIWMHALTPPVRAYVRQNAARLKRVAFFCTEGGKGDQKAFDEMSQICGKSPQATLVVKEKDLLPSTVHARPLREFVTQLRG